MLLYVLIFYKVYNNAPIKGPSCRQALGVCRAYDFLCKLFYQIAQYGTANVGQMPLNRPQLSLNILM